MPCARRPAVWILGSVALLAAFGAGAAKVYRWTDRAGITHYGDHVPDVAPSQM